MKRESFAFRALLAALSICVGPQATFAETAAADEVFASVGEISISREEFEREVYAAARQTYYHGEPPSAAEYIEFRKGVADRLIDRQVLLEEAERREIEPDTASIEKRIAQYEARYGDTERWQSEGPAMAAALRQRFEQDSILELFEKEIRRVDEPDAASVKTFYDENPELFTQPASNRVAVILLGFAPSAGASGGEVAREQADRILDRLAAGADFAELAALHSSDPSSQAGGDMGYQHQGALSPDAEAAIAELEIGGVSAPVRVLEGIAIFKLLDRRTQTLQDYADVEERAEQLWIRRAGDERWQELVAGLRAKSDIRVDTDYLAHVPGYDD
ncbi:MAG: peptidylprolyl isomerase [Gammaproteobacteria bacterium]|jgi:parvulin-like peptidyl-prolyl isomerase|nr:peptidylprolyl isomerase [Gammaproteobacteria bacterium]MDH3846330.1 peptidylprolyl isomerase [Gammaproteobacteria bacterium]MDH3863987.1 peptidylprolyl isomerase [Gammaproteobacteria bacterium]MDH3904753.1 peptidylprolyl isomerase [Gammaproteobacteria bacterium]MDH4003594.1 peptidylprolyl isomerase [Gammaproteobacteria bacterium]